MHNKCRLLTFTSIFVFMTSNSYTEANPKTFMFNGEKAVNGQFPYQAAIQSRKDNAHLCSGSIINNRYILTSAHCSLKLIDIKDAYAIIGTVSLSEDRTEVDFEEIITHPSYDKDTYRNDIALMRTVKSLNFSRLIQPVDLPDIDLPVQPPTKGFVSGWGYTVTENHPDILQFLETRTLSHSNCETRLEGLIAFKLQISHICIVNAWDTNACYNDEGNPFVVEHNILYGILSWYGKCSTTGGLVTGHPNIYTNVFYYLDWIKSGGNAFIIFDYSNSLMSWGT